MLGQFLELLKCCACFLRLFLIIAGPDAFSPEILQVWPLLAPLGSALELAQAIRGARVVTSVSLYGSWSDPKGAKSY